jgi:hypothetical protein
MGNLLLISPRKSFEAEILKPKSDPQPEKKAFSIVG